ncbi:MAG TPA: protein kinase [Vicinamibacterales bacterium]|nr:protein kinase [Vicinamibacterales bacterium]
MLVVATGLMTPVPQEDAETVFLPASRVHPPNPDYQSDTSDTTGLPPAATGVRHTIATKSAVGPLKVGEQFGTRYTILRQLGIGGMGAVYQAWDAELNVAVALKVIRPETVQDPGAAHDIERRFKQELLLARQVTHKNVVRIHDLGEINSVKYITMPYIEGADLASVLRDTPRLPIPRITSIARQVAAGLQAAHEAGVVHRDLKPANVMIEQERAIIMDFGIARSTSRVGSVPSGPAGKATASSNLPIDEAMTRAAATIVGAVIGTIEYMAPEQARGEHVDHRADIYAFGLILYDMLAGRRRIDHAPSAVYELQKRMGQAPPSVKSIVPQVPEALDKLVARCIEPDAAKRFQTASELVAALDRLDDNGKLRPVRRVIGLPYATAAGLALLALSVGIWFYTRPPVQHDPVSVVIADLENRTNDPALNRVLEPMLRRALEGAGFITAFDRSAITRTFGVQPPDQFGEVAARELAVKQGLGVVLTGTLDGQGRGGYRISVKATRAVTGDTIVNAQGTASSNDQILEASTRLMTRVRNALGDDESESSQMFAMTSLSATSLDVVRHFATALEATSKNNFEDARGSLLKAIELDPRFGIGYQSLAVVSRNLGQPQDALANIKEALRYLDGMTERERYNTRGMYSRLTGDYQQCVKEYGELISRYAADVVGHNQLALCYTKLRRMREAVDEMRRVVQLLPNLPLFRTNLSYYASYASDFPTAEQEALAIQAPDRFATLALAFAQVGQGRIDEAKATYAKLTAFGPQGASMAASGLGDIATYEGRFQDAARILQEGATADIDAKYADRAGAKLVALAQVYLSQENRRAAAAAAEQALMHSRAVPIRFLAARTFVETGDTERARREASTLASELETEPQAYAKIIEGGIALKAGDARRAVTLLQDANQQFDTWIGHFDLGRAYLEVGGAETRADSEFDDCLKRRGEAISLFLDEEPTYGYLPSVYYYQGRGREKLGTTGYRESYRQYLAIRGTSEDRLAQEIRKRVGN